MTAGRPRKPFDQKLFEELCHIQCTETEIAAVMDMSRDVLEKNVKEVYDGENFSTVYERKREGGKRSLRRAQWKKATEGNGDTVMQIFLGKNLLGQKDKHEVEHTGEVKIQIEGYDPDWGK